MASSGRGGGGGWRGRGRGGRRGGRGGGGGYREYRPRRDPLPTNTEDLESHEIEAENKTITISVKSNDQGRFFKLIEQKRERKGSGHIIFSVETAPSFKRHLAEVIEKYKTLSPVSTEDDNNAQRHYSESFNQGKRRFYVDLRQNSMGCYLKVTQATPTMRKFVLIPAEILEKVEEHFLNMLDKFGTSHSQDDSSPPRSPQNSQPPLPGSHEVRAGSKTFYFDVERNDRGVFLRLTELLPTRRTHINIPNSCWSQMSDIFKTLHSEMPYADSGSGSGSEDN
ncbi:PREDICTED: transcriptional activator protein Pur-alpha-like [Amphimedon queenslandica]|uniref:Uncharacterized protein n=1 Tax=Amphimedon queenslandica TaxID=400682 RepID=A0A1X7V3M4_AMPQE|nr:PREDICTED: transcriptional activator protein Pur-alpha-like [Amphimedon queenslandica]|eukprot:XP_003385724.1 PREDICTED: transcriptional activator protein Pur-alpha-like [Amphimedon queenslandica]